MRRLRKRSSLIDIEVWEAAVGLIYVYESGRLAGQSRCLEKKSDMHGELILMVKGMR